MKTIIPPVLTPKSLIKNCLPSVVAGLFATSLLVPASHAADCATAGNHKTLAVALAKENKLDEAFVEINASIELCDKFDNWYTLGSIEKARANNEEAASAYMQAKRFAENEDQSLMAVARYAEVLSDSGKKHLASSLLTTSRKKWKSEMPWIKDLSKKLDVAASEQPLTAQDLTAALDKKAYSNIGLDADPTVNLKLNFKHNSVEPVDNARFDLTVLTEAFAEQQFSNKRFVLVGHTDSTGEHAYNQALSEDRARSIHAQLVGLDSSLSGRLSIEGAGERKPLYANETDDIEKMLNRRLEIRVID